MKIFESRYKIIEIGIGDSPEEGSTGAYFIKVYKFLFLWLAVVKCGLYYRNKQ